MKSVIEVNKQQRELIINKLSRHLGDLKDKNIFVLGLAFKAHTDDVRESGAIDIIKLLQDRGANIIAYDPLALLNAKKVLGGDVKFVGQPSEGAVGADAIVIACEWPQFKDLDWKDIKNSMRNNVIIDGRNLLEIETMKSLGFAYECIGRVF